MSTPHGETGENEHGAGFAVACRMLYLEPMLASAGMTNGSSVLARISEHPRLREAVVGRLLELFVHGVEAARERVRARIH